MRHFMPRSSISCCTTVRSARLLVGDVVGAAGRGIFFSVASHMACTAFSVGHVHHCRAARQQQVAVAFYHLQQPRQHHLVVRSEQPRAQNGEMGLRIGQRQLLNYLLAGGLAAREFVGVALRAEVFGHVAVMVVIEIDRRGGDVNELRYAAGRRPFAEAAGGADVGQFEGSSVPRAR